MCLADFCACRVKGTVSTQVQDGNYYINMFDTQKGSTYLVEVDL